MKRERVIYLDMNLIYSIQTSKSRFEKERIIRKDGERKGNISWYESDIQYSN